MKNKIAIVTGGNAGIGRSLVLEFSARGAKVLFCGRRDEEGKKVEEEVRRSGGEARFFPCDVSDDAQVKDFIDKAEAVYGGLDFAVNNAGVGGLSLPLHDYPEKVWEKVVNVNLKGTWLCMKYEIPLLLKRGKGAIVNISSIAGIVGADWKVAPYSAAKHGIIGLTKSAALEYAEQNIRVNAVCPGFIRTEMLEGLFRSSSDPAEAERRITRLHPANRLPEPEEVAKAAIWLCSDEASFITGAALPVDGGYTAK
ncbi:putative 2,5-dichloro-2,5-cyclohexadiene-1,4-diol dehydrogenase [Leptospira broomii serovar Hurstbridge str. 5399]|uniref:2,5-dichloro-2,5-cyclohexadiene-1,4-diol dehydrogenase n=1 Tax=Leptospira broomii serovar Hurstbridge str. 5399 TaxID=1049789 RepID=T0FEX4_9LEPT|nr:glucose 1-dehydrogenase [Leptospira broomii]EQA46137.1 putative 2,5-dichloro-2,5-cyclohexadiene-1,4-diol dehydrogenase [Leptospira broomii serovar Hurstbridge str. 5399]